MKWDDIWKLVLAVLSSVGGIGAIIVFMVKICSNMIANKLSKKYELKLNKELEKYKAGIDNKTYISKARFDREFSMYQDLCEKNITMVYDMGAAVMIARGGQYPNINNTEEFIHLALQHIDDAEMANKRYAPFIAKEIFESYKELGKQAYFIISLLTVWDMFETKNYTTINYNGMAYTKNTAKSEIEDKQKQISKLSDDILDKLRDYHSSLDTLEEQKNGKTENANSEQG